MAESKNLEGKKVLLVEDDIFFADMMSKKLSPTKCSFSHVGSGEEAIAELAKIKPDVLILDLLLPGKTDGFGVLKAVKNDPNLNNIPVVILSNMSSNEDVEKGMKLGAYRYLVKAMVTLDEIVANIQSALDSKIK